MNKSVSNSIDLYLAHLFGRIDYERQVPDSVKNFDLSKMRQLMKQLGDVQNQYAVIHVAGTKGKGSVCAMLGSVLTAAGYKTGVYTSPHLESIHQRMAIDGTLITDEQLVRGFDRIDARIKKFDLELIAADKQPVSFFEYITALAFDFFANEKCEIVVLETGLGGRLDSTNICQPAVCVITNISLDHTRILGDTVELIAAEKGGIIKPGVPVVSGVTDPSSGSVIRDIASARKSPCWVRGEAFEVLHDCGTENDPSTLNASQNVFSFKIDAFGKQRLIENLQLKMPGRHQRENAGLVLAAVELMKSQKWDIGDDAISRGLSRASMPGRTEVIGNSPTVLMDMAHNTASIAALREILQVELPVWKNAQQKILVFGTTRDKDCRRMLTLLLPLFDRVVFTKYKNNPRAMAIEKLNQIATPIIAQAQHDGHEIEVESCVCPVEAWQRAIKLPVKENFICVAGSAFLIAEIRPSVQAFFL